MNIHSGYNNAIKDAIVVELDSSDSESESQTMPLISRSREVIANTPKRTNREWIDLILVLLTLLWTETARGIVLPTQAEYVDEVISKGR